MRDLNGKTAIITGGASGIGFALARVFAQAAGMNILIADIDETAMAKAKAELSDIGVRIETTPCDVSEPASVMQVAAEATRLFGRIHLVCNNAGVYATGRLDDINLANWRWVMDVNVMGLLHGIKYFVPLLQAHGEGGHVINTCSIASMMTSQQPGAFSPYGASKYAASAISERLAVELEPQNIGVTLLCPDFVKTNLTDSERYRPERYRKESQNGINDVFVARIESGISPDQVATLALEGVLDNKLYIFTKPESRILLKERFDRILASFDR